MASVNIYSLPIPIHSRLCALSSSLSLKLKSRDPFRNIFGSLHHFPDDGPARLDCAVIRCLCKFQLQSSLLVWQASQLCGKDLHECQYYKRVERKGNALGIAIFSCAFEDFSAVINKMASGASEQGQGHKLWATGRRWGESVS
jgi:hypothetical protein